MYLIFELCGLSLACEPPAWEAEAQKRPVTIIAAGREPLAAPA